MTVHRNALLSPDTTLNLTENATKVLEARYLKKNEAGECVEVPADLFRRVAATIADVERQYGANEGDRQRWEDRFFDLMASRDYMPNSPTLMNAGREMGMLSACFVLPVRDSVDAIFDSIKHTALIQKAGGGTGFAFDELRPTGDFIQSSGGTTSGPISFWRAFSEATNAIQQGAFRRGANMGMMYIHHPDILKFLHAKQDLTQFTNYNISVKVTDAWMEQYLADPDSPHVVRNPRNGRNFVLPRNLEIWKYDVRSLIELDADLVKPLSKVAQAAYITSPELKAELPAELRGKVYTKREIWNIIIQNAWQTGEPGVVFIDRINEANPTPHVGRIEATNPCGEQPLLPYEACNLGSINLGNFISHGCTPEARVDWNRLREVVHASTRFLDNVIDANNYPLAEIDAVCKANRKIGLGIMGFADALYLLGVPYNSDEGVAWGERFMKFVNDEAHNCSEQLARERGPFPNWKGSLWQTRHNRLMRNACSTTVAPTGTISIIADCSGGIEPMFSLAFIRNVLRGQKQGEKPLVEVNRIFREVAEERGFLSDGLLERIAREGTLAHIDEIPADIRRVFVTAHDITPEWHMRMQAGFQRHNDSSISKTINFPNAASAEQVEEIYSLAFELRCKGVTVYRDGCRSFQPMALKKEEKKAEAASDEATKRRSDEGAQKAAAPTPVIATPVVPAPVLAPAALAPGDRSPTGLIAARALEPADLPEIVSGLRIRQMTPFGNMHVKITVDPRHDRELEVFAQLGKGGDVATSDLEAICRMISLWLRSGGSLRHVIKQLEGIGSSLQIPTKFGRIMSLGDGLACALKKYTKAKERFGLKPLLLGEVDLASLDAPPAGNPDRAVVPASGVAHPSPDREGGVPGHANGKNGGNGNGHSHAPAQPVAVPAAATAAPGNGGNGGRGNGGSGHGHLVTPAPAPAAASARTIAAARPVATTASLTSIASAPSASCCHARPSAAPQTINRLIDVDADADEPDADAHATDALVVDDFAADPLAARINGSVLAEANGDPDAAEPSLLDLGDGTGVMLPAEPEAIQESAHVSATAIAVAAVKSATGNGTALRSEGVQRSETALRNDHDQAEHYKVKCPECGTSLAFQEGCRKCQSCGWAAC